MQARHSSSGAVNDVSGMIRTIIPHSLVKAILASHNETKGNRCSSMAIVAQEGHRVSIARHSSSGAVNDASGMIVAQVWPPLPSEQSLLKPGTRPQVLSMMPLE